MRARSRLLMKVLAALAIALAVLPAPAGAALTVPSTVSFTARLDDAGVPMTGPHNFEFVLISGFFVVWVEAHNGVQVDDGLVDVQLGSITPLTGVFNGQPLSLQVRVDGITLAPNIAIDSVPYAISAGVAANAETFGPYQPADVQERVVGDCFPDANGFRAISAIAADGTVTCQPIQVANYFPGGGVENFGTAQVPAPMLRSCALGQVLVSQDPDPLSGASVWTCATRHSPAIFHGEIPGLVAVGSNAGTAIIGLNVTYPAEGTVNITVQAEWDNPSSNPSTDMTCLATEDGLGFKTFRWNAGDADDALDEATTKSIVKGVEPGFHTYSVSCQTGFGVGRAVARSLIVEYFPANAL